MLLVTRLGLPVLKPSNSIIETAVIDIPDRSFLFIYSSSSHPNYPKVSLDRLSNGQRTVIMAQESMRTTAKREKGYQEAAFVDNGAT